MTRSDSNEPMLSPDWLLSWWRVFGSHGGRQLRCVTIQRGEHLIGLAPFLIRRHWYRPWIPFRRIETLGSGEPEAHEICSEYLNVIAQRGEQQCVAEELARAIAANQLGPWDELVLPLMDGDGVMPDLLAEAFRSRGFRAEVVVMGGAPYITLPSTWDAYLKGLTKKHRYGIVRSLRDFEQWAGLEARMERARSKSELETGKQILITLHRERWQAEGDSGTFRSSRFLAFHDAVIPLLLEQGALELLWLLVRGEPVAAMYNIVWNDRVYFYQCGRKIDLPDHIRPGTALLAHAIRGAIEAGRREFDFLNGMALYKTQLATHRRKLVQLRVARWSVRERLRQFMESGIDYSRGIRQMMRRASEHVKRKQRCG
jgi:CelD/BcsL family acetyltransferase involved in cellulose biosynthesis